MNNKNTNRTPPCDSSKKVYHLINYHLKQMIKQPGILITRNTSFKIYNGNCTEWSAIWSEIKRVITKSHDREAGVRFVITSLISDQNCTTRSAISTLLHSF